METISHAYVEYQTGGRGQATNVDVGQNVQQMSLSASRETESAQILEFRKCLSGCLSVRHTYRPAAKRVPFAEPKVLIVTLKGISQANAPRMRLPNVTATASDSTISAGDITAK